MNESDTSKTHTENTAAATTGELKPSANLTTAMPAAGRVATPTAPKPQRRSGRKHALNANPVA